MRVERDRRGAGGPDERGRRIAAARNRVGTAKRLTAALALLAFGATMLLARGTRAGGAASRPAATRLDLPAQFQQALDDDEFQPAAVAPADAPPVTATRSS